VLLEEAAQCRVAALVVDRLQACAKVFETAASLARRDSCTEKGIGLKKKVKAHALIESIIE
jgi:hypothetical protein